MSTAQVETDVLRLAALVKGLVADLEIVARRAGVTDPDFYDSLRETRKGLVELRFE